jgi:arylsulfatase A
LVIFTSDNGPGREGSAGPLRGRKKTIYEGGMRVPFAARWPGRIPPGSVNREVATTMDLLPTLSNLAGAELWSDRKIDGKNIWPLLAAEPGAVSPHEYFYYFANKTIMGIRAGKWKLLIAGQYNPGINTGAAKSDRRKRIEFGDRLFDLGRDPGEDVNVAAGQPEQVRALKAKIESFLTEIKAERRGIGALDSDSI